MVAFLQLKLQISSVASDDFTAHTFVGSLLRPVSLRKAREDRVAWRLSHAQFKSIEDRAVDEAVSLQEAAGLDIVTDGEMQGLSFRSQMTEAVDGIGAWDIDASLWGHWHSLVANLRPSSMREHGHERSPAQFTKWRNGTGE
jgi:hypothetical protein